MQNTPNTEYSCHSYNKDLPNGKSSGTFTATPSGLQFSVKGKQISVPYAGCTIEIGGASDRIVFFRHPLVKDWTFYTSDRRVLEDPYLKEHPELTAQVKQVKQKRQKHFVYIALAFLLVIGIPSLLIFRMDWVSKQIAHHIPAEWEADLGESTMKQYTVSHEMLDKKETEQLLKPLVDPLLQQLSDSPYTYRFHIAHDATMNAFALPGGYIVIHSQLILEADNAEELLGVLAHEIIHVEEQHGIRNVIGAAGIYTVISAFFGDLSGIFATVAGAAPFLLNQSYSRDFERESDKKGFELLVAANIDPRGLASFFEKLMEKEKKMLEDIEDENTRGAIEKAMGFLSTHPATDERVAYLNELTSGTSGEFRGFDAPFKTLQDQVRDFVVENGGDADAADTDK